MRAPALAKKIAALAIAKKAQDVVILDAMTVAAGFVLRVIGGAVLFAVVYSLLSWLKYRAYMDARFDLGNKVRVVRIANIPEWDVVRVTELPK